MRPYFSIGTGLFIGSGGVYATGGPGFLILDYLLIGTMLLCVVMDLGEMGSLFPISGSFATYSTRFVSPAWGLAMGWNYWLQVSTIDFGCEPPFSFFPPRFLLNCTLLRSAHRVRCVTLSGLIVLNWFCRAVMCAFC